MLASTPSKNNMAPSIRRTNTLRMGENGMYEPPQAPCYIDGTPERCARQARLRHYPDFVFTDDHVRVMANLAKGEGRTDAAGENWSEPVLADEGFGVADLRTVEPIKLPPPADDTPATKRVRFDDTIVQIEVKRAKGTPIGLDEEQDSQLISTMPLADLIEFEELTECA